MDALADHADPEERKIILRIHRWQLLVIGAIPVRMGAAPTLLWLGGALSVIFFPVLAAGAMPAEIGMGTIRRGDIDVIFFDAATHFRDQSLLHRAVGCHEGIGEGVLCFEICADIRRQDRRVAHHVAPVVGPQPSVIIGEVDTMDGPGRRAPLGMGRGRSDRVGKDLRRLRGASSGLRSRAVPFMQKRKPVGFGPSGNTWPR